MLGLVVLAVLTTVLLMLAAGGQEAHGFARPISVPPPTPKELAQTRFYQREFPQLRGPSTLLSLRCKPRHGEPRRAERWRCKLVAKQPGGTCVIEGAVRLLNGEDTYPWVLERNCQVTRPIPNPGGSA
jgi:hypothetical protein